MTRTQTIVLAGLIAVIAGLAHGSPAIGAPIKLADYDVTNCSANPGENGYGPFRVASGFTFTSMSLTGVSGGSWTGHYHTTGWQGSLNPNKYISFSVTPNSGSVAFDRIKITLFLWSAGSSTMTVRSSVDNFASDVGSTSLSGGATSSMNLTVDISSIPNQSGTTEFRIYFHGQNAGGWSGQGCYSSNVGFEVWGSSVGTRPQADLQISKSKTSGDIVAGSPITYSIVVTNAGPSDVTGATVTDDLPGKLQDATWTCTATGGATCTASGSSDINDTVNMPASSTLTYTVNATVKAGASGTLSNTASVAAPSSVEDTNNSNNSATSSGTITREADLAITKDNGQTEATPGGAITYTIVVTNDGPSNVAGATVTDIVPASLQGATWTCAATGGATGTASGSGDINDTVDMPSGSTLTYTLDATLDASATGTLSNTASVSAPGGVTDPTASNDSATDTDSVLDITAPDITCPADVALAAGDSIDPADTGTPVVTDNVDPNPVVTYTDAEVPGVCPVARVITRTWTVTDAAGNPSSCDQIITVDDADSDGDMVLDCDDNCPSDINKTEPGVCGCGTPDTDSDGDLRADCVDDCPNDINKTAPGQCGCGEDDTDTDTDGVADCNDHCPNDPNKLDPGACGCGEDDDDTDTDGVADCEDGCPDDVNKIAPGACGCGTPDTDTDGDGVADCEDNCPDDVNKLDPGACGCGIEEVDANRDGVPDCLDIDLCPDDPDKTTPGTCGCGVADEDANGDGVPDCLDIDLCPDDPDKTTPGTCGCGVTDEDANRDGVPDCLSIDLCPDDPNKVNPGVCGCGVADDDADGNNIPDCIVIDQNTPGAQTTPSTPCEEDEPGLFLPLMPFSPVPFCGVNLFTCMPMMLIGIGVMKRARRRGPQRR